MNYIKFQCYKDYGYTDKDCLESKMAREDFRFLLEKIHHMALETSMENIDSMSKTQLKEVLYMYIGHSEEQPINETATNTWKFFDITEQIFRLLLHYAASSISACSSAIRLERKLVSFIVDSMATNNHIKDYLEDLKQNINDGQCNQTLPSKISSIEISNCIQSDSCRHFINIGIAYIKLHDIYGNYMVWDLGSITAYFSTILENKLSPLNLTTEETLLNDRLTEVFRALTMSNSNLSAYDVVALLGFEENKMNPSFMPDFKKLLSVWEETNFISTPEGFNKGCYLFSYEKEWRRYMENNENLSIPCSDMSYAEKAGFSSCCQIRNELDKNLFNVIQMMKYVQYPPHNVDQNEPDAYNLTIQPNFLSKMKWKYPLYTNTESLYKNSKREISDPLIPFCAFDSTWDTVSYDWKPGRKTGPISRCSSFKPILTDKGVCYSLNSMKFSEIFTDSEYIQQMDSIFQYKTAEKPIVFPQANGPNYGFKFIIDTHTFTSHYKKITNQHKDVDIVIHGRGDLPYFK